MRSVLLVIALAGTPAAADPHAEMAAALLAQIDARPAPAQVPGPRPASTEHAYADDRPSNASPTGLAHQAQAATASAAGQAQATAAKSRPRPIRR